MGAGVGRAGLPFLIVPVVTVAAGMCAGTTPASAAAVVHVATTGTDRPGCGPARSPCRTIEYAYRLVSSGGTLDVAAGRYTFMAGLIVRKAGLRLVGAKAGVDARHRAIGGAGETVITAGGGFPAITPTWTVQANAVTVDGFTFAGNYAGVGISPQVSGTTVRNDIFTRNAIGLYLSSTGAVPSVVAHNVFLANNGRPGSPGNGDAVYANEDAINVTIERNTFRGDDNSPVEVDALGASADARDLTVRANDMDGDTPVEFVSVSDSSITGNSMVGGTYGGVRLSGGDRDVTVARNDIADRGRDGVRITDVSGAPNSGITVADNSIRHVADRGVQVAGSSGVTIRGNLISDPGIDGVGFTPADGAAPSSGAVITGNTITGAAGADPGIAVAAGGYTGPMAVHDNRIVDSVSGHGLVDDDPAATIDAELNWWGCDRMAGGKGCDHLAGTAAGRIAFRPWLTLTIRSARHVTLPGRRIVLTVALRRDSAGRGASGPVWRSRTSGPYFGRVPVTFTTTAGTLRPARTTTSDLLTARTVWHAARPRTARVCATVDHQRVCLRLTALRPVPVTG